MFQVVGRVEHGTRWSYGYDTVHSTQLHFLSIACFVSKSLQRLFRTASCLWPSVTVNFLTSQRVQIKIWGVIVHPVMTWLPYPYNSAKISLTALGPVGNKLGPPCCGQGGFSAEATAAGLGWIKWLCGGTAEWGSHECACNIAGVIAKLTLNVRRWTQMNRGGVLTQLSTQDAYVKVLIVCTARSQTICRAHPSMPVAGGTRRPLTGGRD